MIAFAGAMRIKLSSAKGWKFNVRPRWDLTVI